MPRSAYIHVPFCAHRCGYCDFTLIAGRDELIGDYLRALERELCCMPSFPPLAPLGRGAGGEGRLSPNVHLESGRHPKPTPHNGVGGRKQIKPPRLVGGGTPT
ncbi:MAG: hypothetical protein AABP62_30090, partial [Planctomycetota bacterium]